MTADGRGGDNGHISFYYSKAPKAKLTAALFAAKMYIWITAAAVASAAGEMGRRYYMAILIAFYSRAGENYFGGTYRRVAAGNTEKAAEMLCG